MEDFILRLKSSGNGKFRRIHAHPQRQAFSTTATHTTVTNELREKPFVAIHADATGAINASSAVGREVMLAQFEGLASSAIPFSK